MLPHFWRQGTALGNPIRPADKIFVPGRALPFCAAIAAAGLVHNTLHESLLSILSGAQAAFDNFQED
jgi:hypothetical protein